MILLTAVASVSLLFHGGLAQPNAAGVSSTPPPSSTSSAQTSSTPAPGTVEDKPAFSQEELDQMLAPLALYPDSLLSQILMASTYPLEVVEADRWVKAHKDVKGDAAAKALEDETWDASVKSLVNFPDVLAMLSDKLDWTQKIGDAFLGQQDQVMSTVQKLRGKAKDAGKLETTQQQNVEVKQEGSTQIITIESSDPDVIYVPSYNPSVVYGTWWYPSYPPYPYYPPGYVASNVISFGAGVACGLAWGYAWGHCDWGHHDIDIDINQNFNRNTNINREKYANRQGGGQGGRGKWQHDPSHRQGVGYRDSGTARKYNSRTTNQAAQSREAFRGRAEQGRQQISHGDADAFRGRNDGRVGGGERRQGDARPSSRGDRGGAMDGVKQGNQGAQRQSQRGNTSRHGSAGGSRGGGGRSAGHGGGGGRRGGGGGGRRR